MAEFDSNIARANLAKKDWTDDDDADQPASTATATAAETTAAAAPAPTTAESTTPEVATAQAADVADVADQFSSLSTNDEDKVVHVQVTPAHLTSDISFGDPTLGIPEPILRAIVLKMGFSKPSQIQASSLPVVLKGHNLIAQGQTGSGKTVCFVIAMLNRIDLSSETTQAICLSPTRELAKQIVDDAVIPLSSYMEGIRIETALAGGRVTGRCRAHIVVGTPGKLGEWVKKKYVNSKTVKIMVCDEADVMVSKESRAKGLGKDTLAIKEAIPENAQILFFSATYSPDVLDFSKKIVKKAYVIKLNTSDERLLDTIMQVWMDTSKRAGGGGKLEVLQDIYTYLAIQQSVVFVDTRKNADIVSKKMNDMRFTVSTLHSGLEATERDSIMQQFKSGQSKVLVTTDVLQRGVDIPAIAVVVNYDMPTKRIGEQLVGDTVAYLHRIGRTARFGRSGTAINFIHTPQERNSLSQIQSEFPEHPNLIKEWDVNDVDGFAEHRESYAGEEAPAEDSKIAG